MKEQPLVTVLMPCYNAMPFLPEAIESIINQTYTNLEILCINDGSSDETGAVLDEYAQRDARIRVVHNEENLKLIRTLNRGIELANGKYIARMDADDISFPNRIEVCIDIMLNNESIDLISPKTEIINEKGVCIGRAISRNEGKISSFFASFFFHSIGHPEIFCKTSLLKQYNYSTIPEAIHTEDYELWTRLLHMGYTLIKYDVVLFSFRINPNSVSRKFTELQDKNFIIQVNKFYTQYTQKQIPISWSKVMGNRIDKTVVISDFLNGIREIRWFKNYFIQKQNVKDSNDLNEIQVVYDTHLFDVCYQSLKKAQFSVKLRAFSFLLKIVVKSIFHSSLRKYIFNKIKGNKWS